jgi:hypothetical protein
LSSDQNTGRVAVITGASSGIGQTTARALAANGHQLALLARGSSATRDRAGRVNTRTPPARRSGPEHRSADLDIADPFTNLIDYPGRVNSRPRGQRQRICSRMYPARIFQSIPFTPAARTAIRTSPPPACDSFHLRRSPDSRANPAGRDDKHLGDCDERRSTAPGWQALQYA